MKIPTLINSSSKINGELIFTTDVRIDGEVFGKVESDKNVIVGAEGFVKGFLRAKDLVVFGRIEGNIIVSGITILHEKASVFGNLYTKIFEVKDGATITAKVVTYEKLEAMDEAQIHLAEEMIKIEPNRRQIPSYTHAPLISFDEAIDFVKEDQLEDPSSLMLNKTNWEQMSGNSGDIISRIAQYNTNQEITISHREEHLVIDETKSVSVPADSISQFSGIDESENCNIENATDISFESVDTPISDASGVSEVLVELFPVDLFDESDEMLLMDEDKPEDDEVFTLLSASEHSIEIKDEQSGNQLITELSVLSLSDQSQLLDFDFEDSIVDNAELVLFPLPAPVSIAGCLGEPIKEDSSKVRKGKKKPYSSDPTLISPNTRKNKSYSISGFEELRNLLIPVRFQDIKPIEKKVEQEKYNNKKISETDLPNKSNKAGENNEFFLNDAIRQLPIDDYSSLFN